MNKPFRVRHSRKDLPVAENGARTRAIFNAINDGIFIADLATGRFIEVNEFGCRMFGYRRNELIGAPVARLTAGIPPYSEEAALERIQSAKSHGPQSFEWYAKTKSGAPLWVEISLRSVAFGTAGILVAVVRDISEQKRATEELLDVHATLADAQAVAKVGSFALDVPADRSTWTDEMFRILGLAPGSVVPSFAAYLARIHPDDRSLDDHTPGSLELRVVTEDQKARIVRTRWQNFYDDNGKPARTIGTVQDITESKIAENALRTERDFSATVIDSLPGFFAVLDDQARYVRWNRNLSAFTGLSDKQLYGLNGFSLIVDDDRAEAQTKFAAAFRSGHADVEFRLRGKGGIVRALRWTGRAFGVNGRTQLLAVGLDITDLREAQTAVRQSEQRLAAVFNFVNDGIGVHDPRTGAFIDLNPRLCEMCGYSRDEMFKRSLAELSANVPPYGPDEIERVLLRALSGEALTFEWLAKAKDGHTFWIEISLRRAEYGGREVLLSVVRDVSQRKQTDQTIREEEAKFRGLVEQNVAGVAIMRDDGSVAYVNPYFARMLGYRVSELIGQPLLGLVPASEKRLVAEKLSSHLTGEGGFVQLASAMQAKDGHIIDVIVNASAMIHEGRPASLGVVIDTTEQGKAEAKLREAEGRYRQLFEASRDAVTSLRPPAWTFTAANPAALEMFGASSVEQFTALSLHEVSPKLQPDGQPSSEKAMAMIERTMRVGSNLFEWEHRRLNGECFPTEVLLTPVESAGEVSLYATVRDITERKRTANALAYRDRILNAITAGTAELVGSDSLESGMAAALKIVGEAIGVDRVNLLEMPADLASLPIVKYSWHGPNSDALDQALIVASTPPEISGAISAWQAPLREGAPLTTHRRSASSPIREIMESAKNQSMLMLPIFVGEHFWGTIGIDACVKEREWTPTEIETLQIFAEIVGVVILRNGTRHSLAKSEERFRAVSDTAQDAIIMIDAAGRIEYWNRAAERILGYSAAEAAGKCVHEWLAPERFRQSAAAGMKHFAATGRGEVLGKTLELAASRKDGVEIPVELSVAAMQLDSWHAIAILRDITERKRVEEQLVHMARTDSLTGLPNRTVFVETLQNAITLANRTGERFAVLYLDLDHFKDINDALGHPVGDLLLQEIARRLRSNTRKSDLAARFGGDEFALIANGITDPMDAAVLAQNVLNLVSAPCAIHDKQLRIGASIGIAYYDQQAPPAEMILSQADIALYKSKSEGRGTYRFFTTAMDAEVRDRVILGAELREAIASEQLFLLYQPQIDTNTGRVIGLEALVRWNHPTRGVVSPDQFIPITEHIGIIVPLGRWVVRKACQQMRTWLDAGIAPPLIAVNISATQFATPSELERDMAATLAETGLQPERLELELTESVLMTVSRERSEDLARLHKSGLRIAIDDFGTGYSSLAYLSRLPVDRIKIGQTFIRDLSANSANAAIVRAAIGIAHELGLDVIVEGVETPDQLELIKSWDAHKVQGFYFAKPMPAGEIAPLLAAGSIFPQL
jgi:diguanylate cyclase (GGDEF)-like protein/PAS domain S-box-containing protein